eukprot:COSAG01_NODE_458_length_16743_cov_124.609208_15_plen_563_part_00
MPEVDELTANIAEPLSQTTHPSAAPPSVGGGSMGVVGDGRSLPLAPGGASLALSDTPERRAEAPSGGTVATGAALSQQQRANRQQLAALQLAAEQIAGGISSTPPPLGPAAAGIAGIAAAESCPTSPAVGTTALGIAASDSEWASVPGRGSKGGGRARSVTSHRSSQSAASVYTGGSVGSGARRTWARRSSRAELMPVGLDQGSIARASKISAEFWKWCHASEQAIAGVVAVSGAGTPPAVGSGGEVAAEAAASSRAGHGVEADGMPAAAGVAPCGATAGNGGVAAVEPLISAQEAEEEEEERQELRRCRAELASLRPQRRRRCRQASSAAAAVSTGRPDAREVDAAAAAAEAAEAAAAGGEVSKPWQLEVLAASERVLAQSAAPAAAAASTMGEPGGQQDDDEPSDDGSGGGGGGGGGGDSGRGAGPQAGTAEFSGGACLPGAGVAHGSMSAGSLVVTSHLGMLINNWMMRGRARAQAHCPCRRSWPSGARVSPSTGCCACPPRRRPAQRWATARTRRQALRRRVCSSRRRRSSLPRAGDSGGSSRGRPVVRSGRRLAAGR